MPASGSRSAHRWVTCYVCPSRSCRAAGGHHRRDRTRPRPLIACARRFPLLTHGGLDKHAEEALDRHAGIGSQGPRLGVRLPRHGEAGEPADRVLTAAGGVSVPAPFDRQSDFCLNQMSDDNADARSVADGLETGSRCLVRRVRRADLKAVSFLGSTGCRPVTILSSVGPSVERSASSSLAASSRATRFPCGVVARAMHSSREMVRSSKRRP